jgi:hypothetical protein
VVSGQLKTGFVPCHLSPVTFRQWLVGFDFQASCESSRTLFETGEQRQIAVKVMVDSQFESRMRLEGRAMLRFLHIKNFRLFRDLKIEPLNGINLIAGENNSGKTAMLEALYLLFGGFDKFGGFPSALRSSFAKEAYEQPDIWQPNSVIVGSTSFPKGAYKRLYADEFEGFWMWLFHKRSWET